LYRYVVDLVAKEHRAEYVAAAGGGYLLALRAGIRNRDVHDGDHHSGYFAVGIISFYYYAQ
jgi:hypothetical protein